MPSFAEPPESPDRRCNPSGRRVPRQPTAGGGRRVIRPAREDWAGLPDRGAGRSSRSVTGRGSGEPAA